MARVARVVAEGYPHHITQRGNNRQVVFNDDEDRQEYLSLIKSHSKKYNLDILAYCLMKNHIHFIAVPNAPDSLAKTFNFAHMRYSQYYNKRNGMCGHLWQGRFYSCAMDEKGVYACARYIENNPVRANVAHEVCAYEWSSARVHCGIDKKDEFGVNRLFDYIDGSCESWKKFIQEKENRGEMERIKTHTMKGLPIGEEGFIKKLENKLSRVLKVVPRGRPKKNK